MTETDAAADLEDAFRTPSLTVLEAVADAEGVDPTDLEQPLFHVVDPVALDELFEPIEGDTARRGRVSFQYLGYDVTVYSDGRVELD